MAGWPELLRRQIEAYQQEKTDWKKVARERIFPFLNLRMPTMAAAREELIKFCEPVFVAAQKMFDFEFPVTFVIYIGLGLGAGWATIYFGQPAVLFGLENIAEEGWSKSEAIEGLIAHELGHLLHQHWRKKADMDLGTGPWWQLYTEGFAQRCEHLILGKESWHMARGPGNQDWLPWCRNNIKWLAAEFLRRADLSEDTRPFFGSWLDIKGRKQTGYYLGCQVVQELHRQNSLKEIARMEEIEKEIRDLVTELAV